MTLKQFCHELSELYKKITAQNIKKSMNNLANTKEDVDRQSGRRLIGIAVFQSSFLLFVSFDVVF